MASAAPVFDPDFQAMLETLLRWRRDVRRFRTDPLPDKVEARKRLGISADHQVALVLSGGGGNGWSSAAFGVGARTYPDWDWISIGRMAEDCQDTLGT